MAKQDVVPTAESEKQPFIPYVQEADYPKSLKPVLDPYVARMGFLPNALKLYMHRPEIAETLWKLNSNTMRDASSTLDQNLKRRLSAVISKANGCTYCTAHCCSMLTANRGLGPEGWNMDQSDLISLLQGEETPTNELERVCFDFARSASHDPQHVPDEIYGRLKSLLTPPQIIELACVVGFWKMYNTIHDSLRIPIEAHLLEDTGYVDD
jgi:alkylhydroperoxidase family enzyme